MPYANPLPAMERTAMSQLSMAIVTTIFTRTVSKGKKLAIMKTYKKLAIIALIVTLLSCDKDEALRKQDYLFLKRYCTMVTVGGFMGIAEMCFEIGDVVNGYEKTKGMITIRIAEHSPLNDGPPTSASYQEFLDVPSHYLKLKK
jgi:hypothetical protein